MKKKKESKEIIEPNLNFSEGVFYQALVRSVTENILLNMDKELFIKILYDSALIGVSTYKDLDTEKKYILFSNVINELIKALTPEYSELLIALIEIKRRCDGKTEENA